MLPHQRSGRCRKVADGAGLTAALDKRLEPQREDSTPKAPAPRDGRIVGASASMERSNREATVDERWLTRGDGTSLRALPSSCRKGGTEPRRSGVEARGCPEAAGSGTPAKIRCEFACAPALAKACRLEAGRTERVLGRRPERKPGRWNVDRTAAAIRQWRGPQCFGTMELTIVSGISRHGSSPRLTSRRLAPATNDCREERAGGPPPDSTSRRDAPKLARSSPGAAPG